MYVVEWMFTSSTTVKLRVLALLSSIAAMVSSQLQCYVVILVVGS